MTGKYLEGRDEPILDPDLPIIDSHHHLYMRPGLRYMLDDYLADAGAGHDIRASVYVEASSMWRAEGPVTLRPLGEVEFANGVAAMSASGAFGPARVAAAIVGHADLRLGSGLAELLDRARSAAPDRFRGVRQIAMAHPDPAVFKNLRPLPPPGLLDEPAFSEGLRELARRGLSFDAAVLHHQLPALGACAAAHPDVPFILCHMGLALSREATAQGRAEVFDGWRDNLRTFARHPNTLCKIGGLGTSYWGFGFDLRDEPPGSAELAEAWRPYVETAIEAFGPDRCMMESNYPPDGRSCGFVPLWNALKRITGGYSPTERAAMFHDTAARVYRIALPDPT